MPMVFATNFSDAARAGAEAAARLAARRDERLFLVHVLPEAQARAYGATVRHAIEGTLRDEADRLTALGADVYPELLTGPLDRTLTSFVEHVEADLLTVGDPPDPTTHGRTGGTLDRLLLTTPRPLLVVKDAEPFEAWCDGRRPLRVLLGMDRSEPAQAAREWVDSLGSVGPVDLVAGYVYFTFDEARRLGLPVPRSFDEVSPELLQALEQEVRERVGTGPGGRPVRVRLVLGLGRKADHLVDLARDELVDLLVVGTHQRRALGKLWSVSHHALRLAPMSVACVPAGAAPPTARAPLPRVRRVLASTDFSPLGNRALPYAFALVEPGGEVFLLHVAEEVLTPEMERGLAHSLRELVPEEARRQGKRAHPLVLSKDTAEVATRIVQAAERYDVDLVCLGSHGRTGVTGVLLGSVARAVMGQVHRPLLVVRPPRE